jgi:hypothetical protein
MLKCRDVLALGSLYVDGGVTPREKLALRTHLLICGHCRKFIRSLRLTMSTVERMPLPATDAQVQKIIRLILSHE